MLCVLVISCKYSVIVLPAIGIVAYIAREQTSKSLVHKSSITEERKVVWTLYIMAILSTEGDQAETSRFKNSNIKVICLYYLYTCNSGTERCRIFTSCVEVKVTSLNFLNARGTRFIWWWHKNLSHKMCPKLMLKTFKEAYCSCQQWQSWVRWSLVTVTLCVLSVCVSAL